MATSPLDPGNMDYRKDRIVDRGHGTRALGPSDSSDTGSDIVGARGLKGDVDAFGLDRTPTSDIEEAGKTAGPDVGDGNLDSDSDAEGSGERAAAGRDPVNPDGGDIDVDRIERINVDEDEDEGEGEGEEGR
ncbi:MAG: hypothetical protein ACM3X5_02040 [Bacillota bacterium]